MNCSYRILKNVHIGLRVRKTSDSTTVPFDNEPFKGAKIVRYDKMGFRLTHENLPKEIWLDFEQLPLTKLTIINGVIHDEITFVEKLVGKGTTSMFLMPTEWLDYKELMDDKRIKDENKKYTLSQLNPGDNVISAICREGTVMTYLGRFFAVNTNMFNRYYSYRNERKFGYIDNAPERAFFAIEDSSKKGKYKIVNYPITNKVVAELYKVGDKGGESFNSLFTDLDKNLDIIRYFVHYSEQRRYDWCWYFTDGAKEILPKFDFIINGGGGHSIFIGKTRTNINVDALDYAKKYLEAPNYEMYLTKSEAQSAYNRYNSQHRGW